MACVGVARRLLLVATRQLSGRYPHDAFDGVEWNRVLLVPQVHHQRAVDRHRERQANPKACPLARGRLDGHRAAQLLDLLVDHVHAQTPPGNLRDLLGRGKTRPEDELQYLVVAQLRLRVQQAALDRLEPDSV